MEGNIIFCKLKHKSLAMMQALVIPCVRRKIKKSSSYCSNALTYFVEQIFCKVLVITPGPLFPQISPRKFFFKSRTHMSMTRRPSGVISNPITPAATSSQSSAPAKFVKRSRDLRECFSAFKRSYECTTNISHSYKKK